MAEKIALILLASGLSKRFGTQNKLLAEFSGRTLIEHVSNNLSGAEFTQKFAVTSDSKVAEILSASGFIDVKNFQPEDGQGSALRLGAAQAKDSGVVGACVLLADMPFIDGKYIKSLMRKMKTHDIAMSEYSGIKMPPAIFKGAAFDRLLEIKGERAKPFAGAKNIAVYPLTGLQAMDIDTPADLAAARAFV